MLALWASGGGRRARQGGPALDGVAVFRCSVQCCVPACVFDVRCGAMAFIIVTLAVVSCPLLTWQVLVVVGGCSPRRVSVGATRVTTAIMLVGLLITIAGYSITDSTNELPLQLRKRLAQQLITKLQLQWRAVALYSCHGEQCSPLFLQKLRPQCGYRWCHRRLGLWHRCGVNPLQGASHSEQYDSAIAGLPLAGVVYVLLVGHDRTTTKVRTTEQIIGEHNTPLQM